NEDSRTGQIDVTKIRETNFLRSETRRWAEPDKQACNVAGPSVDCIGGPCEPLELVLTEDLDLLLNRPRETRMSSRLEPRNDTVARPLEEPPQHAEEVSLRVRVECGPTGGRAASACCPSPPVFEERPFASPVDFVRSHVPELTRLPEYPQVFRDRVQIPPPLLDGELRPIRSHLLQVRPHRDQEGVARHRWPASSPSRWHGAEESTHRSTPALLQTAYLST